MSASKGPRSRFTLRMPKSLKAKIERAAKERGASANDWIVENLEKEIRK